MKTTNRKAILEEANEYKKVINEFLCKEELLVKVDHLIAKTVKCIKSGGKVILAGNGGSFADAQHIAAEFVSRFKFDRPPVSALTLGTNFSSLTAIGNDYNFEDIFERELRCLGEKNDLFIALTTSGNSKNILKAVRAAKDMEIETVVLTGNSGGLINDIAGTINVPSESTARIQEIHMFIGHLVCGRVEEIIFSDEYE